MAELTLLHDARSTVSVQEGLRSQRQKIAENSARQAWFTTTHVVSGMGSLALVQPIMFDTMFTHLPCFTNGVVIDKLPDTRHWDYPQVTAGCYDWVTQLMPVARTRQKRAQTELNAALAAGASKAEIKTLRGAVRESHDPSELLYLGAYLYFAVAVPRRSGDTTDLGVRTPDVSMTVHLSWMGTGIKAGKGIESPLNADPRVEPMPVGTRFN